MRLVGRIGVALGVTIVLAAVLVALAQRHKGVAIGTASAIVATRTISKPPSLPAPPAAIVPKEDDCTVPRDVGKLGGPGDLARQNEIADAQGLSRPKTLKDLRVLIASGVVVPIVETEAYYLGKTFAEEDRGNRDAYAHALPRVKAYIDDLLGEGYRCFKSEFERAERERLAVATAARERDLRALRRKYGGKTRRAKARYETAVARLPPIEPGPVSHKFIINSMTRTEAYHALLRGNRHNPNSRYAATGETAESRTPHTTAAVIDIGGGTLTLPVRRWLRARLLRDEREGKVIAIEESNGCFHVMVL